ncbi:MAG TPA: amino acid ABC transporter substrate-binding protein [Burkholderiales bacterium]|jgi:branched-chain amino acid transport system substrate-binding protein
MAAINERIMRSVLALATVVLAAAVAATAHAQAPIRIGASLSQTGSFANLGQNQLRGVQLCIKHANEKGGVLGRKLELVFEDDQSQAPVAVRIYEKLITQDKVDAILGPYSSPITEAVANVSEKYRMPMIAPNAATTSIFRKGRKFVFMVHSAAEVYLEGLIDIAAKRGLKTVAVLNEDTLFPKATAQGTVELAKKRGLQVVLAESYPKGTTDFSPFLRKVAAAKPDVVAAATYFDDAVAITRGLKALDINPKLFGVTVGGDVPKFYEILGRDAELVYGGSQWLAELVTLRAGGLIPIARQYPGAAEFVEAYRKEYPGAGLSYHSAAGYGACQLFLEAVKRAGSLDGGRIRDALLKFDTHTSYGAFKVDEGGFQTAHKMVLFQWQDGKKVIVWPEELAADRPRFPTPAWNQRK